MDQPWKKSRSATTAVGDHLFCTAGLSVQPPSQRTFCPLKIGTPKGKPSRLPTIKLQVRAVCLREGKQLVFDVTDLSE